MKLWKGATFAFMLCGAALSILLTRNMATKGQLKPVIEHPLPSRSTLSSSPRSTSPSSSLQMELPPSSILGKPLTLMTVPSSSPSSSAAASSSLSSPSLSSSSSSSSSSSVTVGGLPRRARAADSFRFLLSEFSTLLQSFTEGELEQVIGTLVDRKSMKRSRRERLDDGSQSSRTKRAKRRLKPCSLREVELTVSELGLGYDSDETLLFRYCSGKCTVRRRNYDITLENMRRAGLLKRGRKDKVHYSPCCRPITYEDDIWFLDNNSRYHTIQEVSAQECGCV